jgi:hypothetical protein
MNQRTVDSPWDWGVVIYSVLALAVFSFPGGVLKFMEERSGDSLLSAPTQLMRAIDHASAAIGLSEVGAELRGAFAAQIEQEDPP